jgi:hypothetical protein
MNEVYLCMRRESTRGDKGPWSEIMMAIIPYMSTAAG